MRLHSMYFICKTHLKTLESFKLESKTNQNNIRYKYMNGWLRLKELINELSNVTSLTPYIVKVVNSIPAYYRSNDSFNLSTEEANIFEEAKKNLVIAMDSIVKTYEVINNKECEVKTGVDILLPKFESLSEFSSCLKDLDFVFTQCPYLNRDDSNFKYGSVDIGSVWITVLLSGAAATSILFNLSKMIHVAQKIKSHSITIKLQEEALTSRTIKNELSREFLDAFREINKELKANTIQEIKNELGDLNDGEEEGKAEKSIDKLAFWLDKGMQIYSTLDAPDEIKNLFPEQTEAKYITDDIMKLIEKK